MGLLSNVYPTCKTQDQDLQSRAQMHNFKTTMSKFNDVDDQIQSIHDFMQSFIHRLRWIIVSICYLFSLVNRNSNSEMYGYMVMKIKYGWSLRMDDY